MRNIKLSLIGLGSLRWRWSFDIGGLISFLMFFLYYMWRLRINGKVRLFGFKFVFFIF